MRSKKGSSSSSNSLKLVPDFEIEKYESMITSSKDLFDHLVEDCSNEEHVHLTCLQYNLSPRYHHSYHPSDLHPGCKCSKIDCLKMYCECFSKGRLCNQNCQCVCCCNKAECSLQIYRAQQLANYRHPGTFKGVPAFVPEKRCTCKKSSCHKNYCQCFRAGLKCTEQCECIDCHNGKPHVHEDYLESRMEIEVNA